MDSDWFTTIYRSILAEQNFLQNPPKLRYGVQTRLRALLEPAITDCEAVSVKRRLQTADCRLQIGDKMQTESKMQTADQGKMQTKGKMQNADCRPGVKCRLQIADQG